MVHVCVFVCACASQYATVMSDRGHEGYHQEENIFILVTWPGKILISIVYCLLGVSAAWATAVCVYSIHYIT